MAGYKPVSQEEQLELIRSGVNPMPKGGWLEAQENAQGGNAPLGGWKGTGGMQPGGGQGGSGLMRGYVPDWLQNFVAGGADMVGLDSTADYLRPGGGGRQTHGTGSGNNPMAFSSPDWMVQSGDFDASNPEQVLKAQQMLNRLGYKDDGGEQLAEDSQMGRKTESAYRQWVNDTRATKGEDTYGYDYNEGNPKKSFFGRAYENVDKALGGYLPGGYKKAQSNMTADEYRNR